MDGKRYRGGNRLRNGFITQVLANNDTDEIVEMGGKIGNIYERFVYKENFTVAPFKTVKEHLLDLKLKFEEEGINLMVDIIKLCMISLYGQSVRTDIDEKYII